MVHSDRSTSGRHLHQGACTRQVAVVFRNAWFVASRPSLLAVWVFIFVASRPVFGFSYLHFLLLWFCSSRRTMRHDFHIRYKNKCHIRACHDFISELLEEYNLSIRHTSTQEMSADFLTKPVPNAKHWNCCYHIGLSIHPNR